MMAEVRERSSWTKPEPQSVIQRAKAGDLDGVAETIARFGPAALSVRSQHGWTPLMVAAAAGHCIGRVPGRARGGPGSAQRDGATRRSMLAVGQKVDTEVAAFLLVGGPRSTRAGRRRTGADAGRSARPPGDRPSPARARGRPDGGRQRRRASLVLRGRPFPSGDPSISSNRPKQAGKSGKEAPGRPPGATVEAGVRTADGHRP